MSGNESLKDVMLRPWPPQKSERRSQQDLLLQIHQLALERGHIRDITEQSLKDDIAAGKDAPQGGVENTLKEKHALSHQETRDKIFGAQKEMHSHLEWAKFAAENALDLISLVLSQDPNKQTATSFSHTFREVGLAQGVPMASFGLSRESHGFHVHKPDEAQRLQELKDKQEIVAKGARMEALDCAADEILQAAKKLEKEVRRETRYWQEIVSVSDKGWPIQRKRQNGHHLSFGVHYGLPEASDHFKAYGYAPLQMDRNGSIILDPALRSKPKIIRVRINENETTIGTSQVFLGSRTKNISVEQSIQSARDSLFEEELFYEMSLETRQLLAYGVEFRNSVISMDAPKMGSVLSHRKILIDCIPRDDHIPAGKDGSLDWFARTIGEALRLLLAHEHNMRLYRRSQLPPPLTARTRETPSPPLLRTLLAIFNHLEATDSLHSYLELVTRSLNSAGLHMALDATREISWAKLPETFRLPAERQLSPIDQLLGVLTKPFDAQALLTLPSLNSVSSERLIIASRTIIGQPTFGTEHKLTLPSSLTADFGLFHQLKFPSTEEVKSYVNWVLSMHIGHNLLKNQYSSHTAAKNHDPKITLVGKGNKKDAASAKHISIRIEQGRLCLNAAAVNAQQQVEDVGQSYTWHGQDGSSTLLEMIQKWLE